ALLLQAAPHPALLAHRRRPGRPRRSRSRPPRRPRRRPEVLRLRPPVPLRRQRRPALCRSLLPSQPHHRKGPLRDQQVSRRQPSPHSLQPRKFQRRPRQRRLQPPLLLRPASHYRLRFYLLHLRCRLLLDGHALPQSPARRKLTSPATVLETCPCKRAPCARRSLQPRTERICLCVPFPEPTMSFPRSLIIAVLLVSSVL